MRFGKRKQKTTFRTNIDDWYSRYIRLRDSNEFGFIRCCTCSKMVYFMDADNGHFIGRKDHALAWDEINCNAQCRLCNRFKEGLKDKYLKFLDDKYGHKQIELLYAKEHNRFDKSLIPIMTKKYRDLSYKLLRQKTLEIQPYWATRKGY